MNEEAREIAKKIAGLNDEFRKSGWGITLTVGVQAFDDVVDLLETVREFDRFNESNDPHGEHDFGCVLWHGEKVFWKIDYYDQALKYWCNPLTKECRRVLTIMLASEY